jgi:hypothetical protein
VREYVYGLRGSIRKLWRGGEVANQIAREFLLAKEVFHWGVEDEEPVEASLDAVKWGGRRFLRISAQEIYNSLAFSAAKGIGDAHHYPEVQCSKYSTGGHPLESAARRDPGTY